MARTARSQVVMTAQGGAEDPFHPTMRARVQNFKSNLMASVMPKSAVWRGGGSWSTTDKHQRVTVKVRFRNEAKVAKVYAKYMVKEGKGLDGATPEAWNATEKGFDAPARVAEWMRDGDQRWFKVVYSPEKPFGDLEGMINHSMAKAEAHLGTKLDWFASRHYDGGKDHVHVFILGRDDQGNVLSIDKEYIKYGFRDSAQRYVTYAPKFGLGERSAHEIAEGKERSREIREARLEVKSMVLSAGREGVLTKRQEKELTAEIYNASPKHLDEIKGNVQKLLDGVDHVWKERPAAIVLDKPDVSISRDAPEKEQVKAEPAVEKKVTREQVLEKIEQAVYEWKIDALDADKFRHSLTRNRVEDVNRAVDEAIKVKSGAARDGDRDRDTERVRRKGGLSL